MPEFKVGDIVECVDNKGKESWLNEGGCYTVASVGQCGEVSVSENGQPLPARFAGSRFELMQKAQCHSYTSKIKSNGGSSDYYKLTIKCASDGTTFDCETGDIIAALVGDNFALGNIVKAVRRMWCDSQGQGKEGIDMQYDANKVKYFVDDFVKRYGEEK